MKPTPERHVLIWPGHGAEAPVEMAFRLIPAGEFRMGSRGRYGAEEPVHRARISQPFWLGETPVTQAQFAVWTGAEGVKHENHFKKRSENPAENVTWRNAVKYCAWLAKVKAGELPEGYSLVCLPTEAEWEYACRAGTDTDYYTGDGEEALAEAGWFGEDWDEGSTHLVRQKLPNAFGLFDMHGNLWEWCHDAWDEEAYRGRVDGVVDPGSDERFAEWEGGLSRMVASDQSRVVRGGSSIDSAFDCRSAHRYRWSRPIVRGGFMGCRVCLARGPAAGHGAPGETGAEAEPDPGAGGRGTRQEADGAGGAGAGLRVLSEASFPRAPGRRFS